MKYTKVQLRDIKNTDWDAMLEVFMLRNQGWEFRQIAKKMGITFQRANQRWLKIKDMTTEELEEMRRIAKTDY